MMYAVLWGGGLCPSCKIQRGGGRDYVLVVKFSGGDYVLVVKFMGGGDFVHVYKNEQGGFCRGGDYVRIPKKKRTLISFKLKKYMPSTRLERLVSDSLVTKKL